jgi:hypothetical protein
LRSSHNLLVAQSGLDAAFFIFKKWQRPLLLRGNHDKIAAMKRADPTCILPALVLGGTAFMAARAMDQERALASKEHSFAHL